MPLSTVTGSFGASAAEGEGEGVAVAGGEAEVEGVLVALALALALALGLTEGDGVSDGVGVTDGLSEALGVMLGACVYGSEHELNATSRATILDTLVTPLLRPSNIRRLWPKMSAAVAAYPTPHRGLRNPVTAFQSPQSSYGEKRE
mgnify:CR=1 FL=1